MLGHKVLRNKVNGVLERDLDIAHLCKDTEAVRNNIEARCQIIRGELKQNILLGIPLRGSKEEIDLAVMDTINSTYGVRSIERFESRMEGKKYYLFVSVLTDFGELLEVEI